MVINEEMKTVIEGSAFLTLVTLGPDGTPHPIVAGKGTVAGDTVVFGIYKMETTRKNLAVNPNAWVVGATKDGGPKGYRLSGTAAVSGKQLIFTPVQAEVLI
jgi:predicted pyridoxine 5'-phosphate oxidase superfamily flavin-nucleotide-binding protein